MLERFNCSCKQKLTHSKEKSCAGQNSRVVANSRHRIRKPNRSPPAPRARESEELSSTHHPQSKSAVSLHFPGERPPAQRQ